jgi:hypothetical protein
LKIPSWNCFIWNLKCQQCYSENKLWHIFARNSKTSKQVKENVNMTFVTLFSINVWNSKWGRFSRNFWNRLCYNLEPTPHTYSDNRLKKWHVKPSKIGFPSLEDESVQFFNVPNSLIYYTSRSRSSSERPSEIHSITRGCSSTLQHNVFRQQPLSLLKSYYN